MKLSIALLFATVALAQSRQLAITIDDLPRGGDHPGPRNFDKTLAMTTRLTAALRGVPVSIYVNPGQARDYTEAGVAKLLKPWRKQGAEIGNHTFSHPDLNKIPLAEYEADILRAEPALRQARGGTKPRYFRHPFLHTGPTEETKFGLAAFLKEHNYEVAPVTIDNSDWIFALVYTMSKKPQYVREEYIRYMDGIFDFFETRTLEVVGREIPQILLIHANQLNADSMPDLLKLFEKRGYKIIPIEEALKDEAYQLKDGYTGTGGISWIHRWAAGKGMKIINEPAEPKWLMDEFKSLR